MSVKDDAKQLNYMKKGVEDYYKSWVKKNFHKGVRDAKVYMEKDCIVIIGIGTLSFVELSIADDEYSKQVIGYTRKKSTAKNYPVLKENIEIITGREIESYFVDLDIDTNTSCMTFILKKEGR